MSHRLSAHSASPSQFLLRVSTAACLLGSAYVHFHLAGGYDHNPPGRGALLTQGNLFRGEAAAALVAALLLLALNQTMVWVGALAVGVGSLAAVLTYRYVDVGALGPLPNMYEPIWFKLKTISAVVEGAAALLVLVHFATRRPSTLGSRN